MDSSLYQVYLKEMLDLMPVRVRFSDRPVIALGWQLSAVFLYVTVIIAVVTLAALGVVTSFIAPLSYGLYILAGIVAFLSLPVLAIGFYNFILATVGLIFWFLKAIGVPINALNSVEDFINLYKLLFRWMDINY